MTADIETVDAHLPDATSPLAAAPASTDLELRLRTAAEFGDVAAIDTLIDAGVDPNACNCADNTALHYAAWRGHASAIEALLCAGADPALATPTAPRPSTSRPGSVTATQPTFSAARAPEPCRSQPASVPTRPWSDHKSRPVAAPR